MSSDGRELGPTRVRDVLVVAIVAGLVAYALTRLNYGSIPRLPRLAGVTAALLGIGEAVTGWGFRRRIRLPRDQRASTDLPRPIDPLVADRVLRVGKASALAGAALTGLWIGFGAYVAPEAGRAVVPAADTTTAVVGGISALVLLAGALWLEFCCRAPTDRADRDR